MSEERTAFSTQLLQEWFPLALPFGPVPDATPPDGPDPYGNPDPDPEWMRIEWREHLRSIELPMPQGARSHNGRRGPTKVNYVELGSGSPTIVFAHGLSGSWQNWLENLPHFAKRHRVVALDFPGFGASPLPPWEITIEAYGRLLDEFCETLEVEDSVLVGNSLGGFISAESTIREPGRFEKLLLTSAAGVSHARGRKQPAETAARLGAALAPLSLKLQERSMLRPRLRHIGFRSLVHRPLRLRRELLWEQWSNGAGAPGFVPAVQALFGYDILDRLEEVEISTLIIWGRNDRIVPPIDAFGYAERLEHSRLVVFDETGHLPQLERPVRFNRLLDEFVAGEAGISR